MEEKIAQEGMWLTQIVVEDSNRIFRKRIKGVDLSNWHEVTDEWKEQWEKSKLNPDEELAES